MIRIKVIPLKKVLYRIQLSIFYISLAITLILVILLFYKNRKDIFTNNEVAKQPDNYNMTDNNNESYTQRVGDYAAFENDNDKHYIKPKHFDVSKKENGNVLVQKTLIKNRSNKIIDLEELSKPSKFVFDNKTSILIFHTHTSETYSISEELYSDYYRTEDENYNVLAVGKSLKEYLNSKGFNCIQNRTVHDLPSYNGAYRASLETVTYELKNNNYDIILDIHRDAISSTPHYRLVTNIDNTDVAQLMFVVGTDASGNSHEKWMENLKLAILIQNKAEEMYPGLFRELTLSSSRYNQHISTGSLIIEVGGTGNTIEEAKLSMKYLSEVFSSLRE